MMRALLLSLVLAGCYQPSFAPCRVRCSDGTSCPSGFSCGADGRCKPDSATDSCDAILDARPGDGQSDDAALDAFDPACVGVVCDDPDPPACSGTAIRTYARPGTCSGGTCSYPFTDRACEGTCTGNRCAGDWVYPTDTNVPGARFAHTAVWTGTEMIIWGGATSSTQSLGDGARFNPSTGQWTAISNLNAPSARRSHSAVWTGTEMIIFGGSGITQGTPSGDGRRYNPTTDTWSALPLTGAPGGRFGHSAVWTGTEMIIWGGGTASTSSLNDGGRFNPATNTWTPISSTGAPGARRDHSAVWTGTEMLVYGGSTIYAGGSVYLGVESYSPATGTWTTLTTSGNSPGGRFSHAAVWTGSEMLVWGGGTSSTGTLDSGARLEIVSGNWTLLPTEPGVGRQLPGVWTGDTLLMFGGCTIVDGSSISNALFGYRLFQP